MDDMREKFEKVYKELHGGVAIILTKHTKSDGSYLDPSAESDYCLYKAGHQQGVKDENSACAEVCAMMNKQPMPEDATSPISTLAAYVQCEDKIRSRIK